MNGSEKSEPGTEMNIIYPLNKYIYKELFITRQVNMLEYEHNPRIYSCKIFYVDCIIYMRKNMMEKPEVFVRDSECQTRVPCSVGVTICCLLCQSDNSDVKIH